MAAQHIYFSVPCLHYHRTDMDLWHSSYLNFDDYFSSVKMIFWGSMFLLEIQLQNTRLCCLRSSLNSWHLWNLNVFTYSSLYRILRVVTLIKSSIVVSKTYDFFVFKYFLATKIQYQNNHFLTMWTLCRLSSAASQATWCSCLFFIYIEYLIYFLIMIFALQVANKWWPYHNQ